MSTSHQTDPVKGKPTWFRKHRRVLIELVIVVVVVLGIFSFIHNRAADVFKPLGKEMVRSGGIEECAKGDPGRGPDTAYAHYGASYDLHMSKDDAIALVNKVARDNGYSSLTHTLAHSSPGSPSSLGDKWYFDDTSKQNPYNDIQPGPITLSVFVDGPGSHTGCAPYRTIQAGHIQVGIDVVLPDYKRFYVGLP